MQKQAVLKKFRDEHLALQQSIEALSDEQIVTEIVEDGWTVKDIIGHVAAWHWGLAEEVERVLKNEAQWHIAFATEDAVDEFNKLDAAKRKDMALPDVLQDWEDSFQTLITRIESLTDAEWLHQSGTDTWEDGSPASVSYLFEYEYEGSGHEGGHAKQIQAHFGFSVLEE